MSIAQMVEEYVGTIPAGQIFDYQTVPSYVQSPNAVMNAISRLVAKKRIKRLSKGKFYIPKEGFLGEIKPTDNALIRSVLYKDGRLNGYVTGMALYNQLGLSTQIPSTIEVAFNGGNQMKEFGTIRIKKTISRIPISKSNVKFLQYLDVLKNIKKISDSGIGLSLKIMRRKIGDLTPSEQKRLIKIAKEYYSPQARALTGLLFESLEIGIPNELKNSLNPATVFKLNLDKEIWPQAPDWNIK